jgi:tRNA A37 threonylcarbamoyltransferase TsaD
MRQLNNVNLLVPPINLCGDNAAMIGLAAYYHIVRGDTKKWNQIKVDSNLKL